MGVEIGLQSLPGEMDADAAYYATPCRAIDEVVEGKLHDALKSGDVRHLSVFAWGRTVEVATGPVPCGAGPVASCGAFVTAAQGTVHATGEHGCRAGCGVSTCPSASCPRASPDEEGGQRPCDVAVVAHGPQPSAAEPGQVAGEFDVVLT
jgi:hypothetical protein